MATDAADTGILADQKIWFEVNEILSSESSRELEISDTRLRLQTTLLDLAYLAVHSQERLQASQRRQLRPRPRLTNKSGFIKF